MSVSDSRNEFFDVCKGIGILCVYYGHTTMVKQLPWRMVFSFHMPLFLLLSGIFFNVENVHDLGAMIRKVWRNLLVPYCFFVVVGSILKADVTVSRWHSNPLGECIRFVHGEGSESIWFLVCLAMAQILVWLFIRSITKLGVVQKSYALAVIALVSLVGGQIIYLNLERSIITRLPFMLASVPAGMFFFAIGILFKEQLLRFSILDVKLSLFSIVLVAMFLLFVAVNCVIEQTFDIRTARFDISVLPSCFLGIAIVFVVAKVLNAFQLAKKLFARIGERSLFLFALELPLSYFVGKATGGTIPRYMWRAEHALYVEPIRIAVILMLAWLCSYPTMWLLGKLRRLSHV